MKKVLFVLGTAAILFVALFAACQKADVVKEPGAAQGVPPFPAPLSNVMLTTVSPFDVSTYPERFAGDVAEVEKEVMDNNGLALIGRVVDAEGKPLTRWDFDIDAPPGGIFTWDGGWFMTPNIFAAASPRVKTFLERVLSQGMTDNQEMLRFTVYTTTNEPIIGEIPITPGKVYYTEIKLPKMPAEALTFISGTMLDEDDNPIEDATVYLCVDVMNYVEHTLPTWWGTPSTHTLRNVKTDEAGRFVFDNIARQPYLVLMSDRVYKSVAPTNIPPGRLGAEHLHVFRHYKAREVEIEYIYQPDGSRDFTKGNLHSRTATLKSDPNYYAFRFDSGEVSTGSQDIQLSDGLGDLRFSSGNRNSTFYDAGEVPFESVREADERSANYNENSLPITLNHVYVVKTQDENYAKFIVRKIAPPLPASEPTK